MAMRHDQITARAAELQAAINERLAREYENWSPFAVPQELTRIAEEMTGGEWRWIDITHFKSPPQIALMEYTGSIARPPAYEVEQQ